MVRRTRNRKQQNQVVLEAAKPSVVEEVVVADSVVEETAVEVKTFGSYLEKLIHEFGEKVGEEKAVKLAQRLLNIGQNGKLDERTLSAYNNLSNRNDFHNDYVNTAKE